MTFSGWKEEPTIVYPYNGILHSNIKEHTIDTHNLDGFHSTILGWNKVNLKRLPSIGFNLYDIPTIIKLQEQISGGKGLGLGEGVTITE